MSKETADKLIAYSRENSRICPQPLLWNDLWNMLPGRRQIGAGWEPPLPLILGAWYSSSNLEKMVRLAEHIQWADKQGGLAEVAAFLHGLAESEWHHLGD